MEAHLRVSNVKAPSKTDDLLQYGSMAARMLKEIAEATGAPYLKTIAGLTTLIIQTVETVRYNKEECVRMTGCTYELICAIINICKNTEAELPPTMVRNIEQFQETLQKFLTYVRMHVDGTFLRRIIKHMHISSLLADCNKGIQHALDVFGVQSHVITSVMLAEMQEQASRRHQEIMDVLSSKHAALPPGTTLDDLRRSSSSLSLLPPSPQIFSGRDKEQQQMITTIQKNIAARIAILGPGGIGKTSLALSVLHDHNVVDMFGTRRYFISCDAAITSDDLITIVAKYYNLEEKAKPSNAIIHYLNRSTEPALMVLDNFETPWEIPEQRSKVENFLSLLANITHLSIVLTMRGVERPSKIRWTRPFLPPLQPLANDAAEEIFRDIADISNDDPDLLELLKLTDNLPLAVTLMARLAESETCTGVLARWRQENTSLLSDGVDKLSSLEKSVSISISSPRMTATPHALELLSLLSLLPDGIPETTLLQMDLPFDNVVKCRFILVSTSLAYVDNRGRVKALTPIREYIHAHHPPQNESLQSLNAHVHQILDVWTGCYEFPSKYQMDAIWNELGNIYSILSYNLYIVQDFSKDEYRTVKSMISLLRFMDRTARVSVDFALSLRSIIKQLGNQKLLQGDLLFHLAAVSTGYTPLRDVKKDLEDAYNCFESLDALNEQVMVIISLSRIAEDSIKARYMARKAVSLAKSCSLKANVQIMAFMSLSEALISCGYVNDALNNLNKPEALARGTGKPLLEFRCMLIRARAYMLLGRLEEASMLCNHAVQITDALCLSSFAAVGRIIQYCYFLQSNIFFLRSEYHLCREVRQTHLQDFSSEYLNDSLYHALVLSDLIDVDIATGRSAIPQLQQSLKKLESIEKRLSAYRDEWVYTLSWSRSQLYFANGDLKNAALQCIQSLVRPSQIWWEEDRPNRLHFLGDIYLKQYEHDSAMNTYILSLAFSHKTRHKPHIYQAIRRIGDVFLALDDINSAFWIFQTALEAFIKMDIHRAKGDCMIRLGDIAHQRGELSKAKHLWEDAIPLFKRSEQVSAITQCESRLGMLEM